MDKEEAREILHNLNRKLTLLRGERKAVIRKQIIDSILFDDDGEEQQLKNLLGVDKK